MVRHEVLLEDLSESRRSLYRSLNDVNRQVDRSLSLLSEMSGRCSMRMSPGPDPRALDATAANGSRPEESKSDLPFVLPF